MKKPILKPCPFCGSAEAPNFISAKEIAEMYYGHDDESPVDAGSIICNFNKGGCGSVSGHADSRKHAVDIWNNRAGAINLAEIYPTFYRGQ